MVWILEKWIILVARKLIRGVDKNIIAHGQLITQDAQFIFNKAFDWI
jgi:hypothetical protein